MFPRRELTGLARRKEALRMRIARDRFECFAAAGAVARPLRWLDRLHAWWRATPTALKFAAMPLVFFLKRKLFRKTTSLGALARWVPLAWQIVHAVRGKP